MNKYQKELIAKCEPYVEGTPFDYLYVIPAGKLYNGFWGKNGYNKIYLVCKDIDSKTKEEKCYLIGDACQVDVVHLGEYHEVDRSVYKFDVIPKLNCTRIYTFASNKKLVVKCILSCIEVTEVEVNEK